MGSTHDPNMKLGIKFNGIDAVDIHPDTVREIIQSDETGIVRATFQAKLDDFEEKTVRGRDDYAKAYGRPDLKDLLFGRSENDGYLYLDGHAPNCSGPDDSYIGGCWCKWIDSDI